MSEYQKIQEELEKENEAKIMEAIDYVAKIRNFDKKFILGKTQEYAIKHDKPIETALKELWGNNVFEQASAERIGGIFKKGFRAIQEQQSKTWTGGLREKRKDTRSEPEKGLANVISQYRQES